MTEITWEEEDALPFPLCLSAMGPAPSCEVMQNVSVVRANLVLVDHGRPIAEDLDPVPVKAIVEACGCDGTVKDTEIVAYCRGPFCVYADDAVRQLRRRGFNARRLEDGFPEWRRAGLPIEAGAGD